MLICLSGADDLQDAYDVIFLICLCLICHTFETKPHAPCQISHKIICFPNEQVKLQMCSAIVVVLSYIL
jgi:hypothetical protein